MRFGVIRSLQGDRVDLDKWTLTVEKEKTYAGTGSVRADAEVKCRFHDLRHTACTKTAEGDVPEATVKALMGHMSAPCWSGTRLFAWRRSGRR
jgi:integrase